MLRWATVAVLAFVASAAVTWLWLQNGAQGRELERLRRQVAEQRQTALVQQRVCERLAIANREYERSLAGAARRHAAVNSLELHGPIPTRTGAPP